MLINFKFNTDRLHYHNDLTYHGGSVVYWMSRDQRLDDNWAFLYAIERSVEYKSNISVVFCLVEEFLNATQRQFDFMLKGLAEVDEKLRSMNIPFIMLNGSADKVLPEFISKNKIGLLISEFDPLRIKQQWQKSLTKELNIPFHEVDAHNIVPCRIASGKKEFSARTIRPKISSKLMDFLTEYPNIAEIKLDSENMDSFKWERNDIDLSKYSNSPTKVNWLSAGSAQALRILQEFIEKKADTYAENRNQPAFDALSNLSPYLHFGQIASQRIAIEVKKSHFDQKSKDGFLEEIIIRKELSDNFCYYEKIMIILTDSMTGRKKLSASIEEIIEKIFIHWKPSKMLKHTMSYGIQLKRKC
jgi:deoxyribodipyrimidine photo-lyase